MKLSKILTFILTTVILYSCGQKDQNSQENRDLPELNVTKTATLQTRGDSNYKEACLFLTSYDRNKNDPAILLQNNDDLSATQVTDDIGSFTALLSGSNHSIASSNKVTSLGDRIDATNYQVGDEYMLEKEDSGDKFVMTFKILEVNPGQNIKIEYQVKSYTLK